jgi:hypothetical protein
MVEYWADHVWDRGIDPASCRCGSEVGITNRDPDRENENVRRTQRRRHGQQGGETPIGTHKGTTLDEQERDIVLHIAPGTEAERGADRVTH